MKEIFEKYSKDRENLIPVLQAIQEKEGFLSEDSIVEVGKYLGLPASKVFGVATFYNQFRFQPKGKYHIQLCRGTACHVLGSATVLDELQKALKIKNNETTKDGKFSLEVVACIGACGLAPVVNINGEFYGKVTKDSLLNILKSLE